MNYLTMAFIDRYIGIVACFVMDIVQLFRDVIRKVAVKDRSIKKILLIKFLGMGSIILLKPAVRQIRGTYKDAKISFVTFAENREILRHFSDIDEVITLRRNSAIIFCDIISTIVKLYVHGYDVVIDFEFLPRLSVVLAFFSRAWIRIGFFLPGIYRGKLLLNRRLPFNYYQHVAKSFAELVALIDDGKDKIGLNGAKRDHQISLKAGEKEKLILREYLTQKKLAHNDKYIVVNANAGTLGTERRKWPEEYFAELIGKISEKYKEMKFVFIGSKSEKEYVQKVIGRIRSRSNNVINTAGEVDLSCLAEIIKRSVCMITNDSGPMHLSAALKVPVFALFGPETPQLFAPLGDNHTVFYKQLYCSPCHNIYNSKICNCENDNRCLKEIRVNDVYEKVDEFLIQQNKQ